MADSRFLPISYFGVYAENWLATRITKSGSLLRPTTQVSYHQILNKGLSAFAKIPLTEINSLMIRAWHSDRLGAAGASMAGKETRVLRVILNTAVADGLLAVNPVPPFLARTSTGIAHRPPTELELTEVLKVIEPKFVLAVLLAAFAGLRLGEWRALLRCDIMHLPNDRFAVTVNKQAQKTNGVWAVYPPKSRDSFRLINLPAWASDHVLLHLETYTASQPNAKLFDAGQPNAYVDQAWRRAWDDARRAVGIIGCVRGHDLRHYYGTALAQRGVSPFELKNAMGHANIATTMVYIHLANGASAEVADLLPAPCGFLTPGNRW